MSSPAPPPPKSILIVGGSLGGIFTAIALRHLTPAPRVTVLERNPSPLLHNQGAGVVTGGDTQKFFARFDRYQRPLAVSSKARQYLNRNGDVIDREEREQKMTSWDLLWNVARMNADGGGDGRYVDGHGKTGDNEGDGAVQCVYEHDRQVTDIELIEGITTTSICVKVTWKSSSGKTGSHEADLLIAADGPSSTIRGLLAPEIERKYAGYVAWRGTVPETQLSDAARKTLVETFTFYHASALQMLAYTIPGKHGSLKPGERLINWVWYVNYEEDSTEHEELFTDVDGHRHRWTLPVGKMRPVVWEKQKTRAGELLPPQFAELVQKTSTPFVQAITDVLSDKCEFWGGKVLLCGDAVAGFRPHTAASTSQAAFDAMGIFALLTGEITLDEWRDQTMDYARELQKHGVYLGERSQFGRHPLAS